MIYTGIALTALGSLLGLKFAIALAATIKASRAASDDTGVGSLIMLAATTQYGVWFILCAVLFGTGAMLLATAAIIHEVQIHGRSNLPGAHQALVRHSEVEEAPPPMS